MSHFSARPEPGRICPSAFWRTRPSYMQPSSSLPSVVEEVRGLMSAGEPAMLTRRILPLSAVPSVWAAVSPEAAVPEVVSPEVVPVPPQATSMAATSRQTSKQFSFFFIMSLPFFFGSLWINRPGPESGAFRSASFRPLPISSEGLPGVCFYKILNLPRGFENL